MGISVVTGELRAFYPESSTIKKRQSDPDREERIHEEIIVDTNGPEEHAMGWYYYLESKLPISRPLYRFQWWFSAATKRGGRRSI
jgi:Calcium binding